MKRVWMIAAVCLLLALLCACGAPEETAAPANAEPETKEEPKAAAEAEAPTEPEAPEGPMAADALAFVDQDVSAMIAAIGEPVSASYEASCMGDGDDGILEYDGFIVFTYREKDGSAETVIDAE